MNTKPDVKTVGIAGLGAVGSAVGRALIDGIDGLEWTAASNLSGSQDFDIPIVPFEDLAGKCDIIVEALPAAVVPELAEHVFKHQKRFILISSCALLLHPEILNIPRTTHSPIYVPSGALRGIKLLKHWSREGITKAKIKSSKNPRGFKGTPYVDEMGINLDQIDAPTSIFDGNALEAAKGFPANVNVAATLAFSGVGPEDTHVELWADPNATGNTHEVTVTVNDEERIGIASSTPDPKNPKSSTSTADSIVDVLHNFDEAIVTL